MLSSPHHLNNMLASGPLDSSINNETIVYEVAESDGNFTNESPKQI